MFKFAITLKIGARRICAVSRHSSGSEALSEICEALGIIYPSAASIRRLA